MTRPPAPHADASAADLRAALRRAVLAASVLDDIDVSIDDAGVRLPGCTPLPWPELATVQTAAPTVGVSLEEALRLRIRLLLLAHQALHRRPVGRVAYAVPKGSAIHLGAAWDATAVAGGAVDLGAGVLVDTRGAERVLPIPRVSALSTGTDSRMVPDDLQRLETMGDLVVTRLRRDASRRGRASGLATGVLRPVGGCDVPSLLATRSLRSYLVRAAESGGSVMRAVAAPVRSRGWFDLARIDPAFVIAAWSATDPADRGFSRAVFVTRDELALAPLHPRIADVALRD